MDIGRAYKCAISSRDLGIVGIALQNAEPRGTKVVRGLGECDDIALLGLSLKERDLLVFCPLIASDVALLLI